MNKKNFMIGVSVLLLGASVFLLYRTFFSSPAATPSAATLSGGVLPNADMLVGADAPPGAAAAPVGGQTILPYGKTINFEPIEKYNATHKKITYPQVNPDEVGVTPGELIKF